MALSRFGSFPPSAPVVAPVVSVLATRDVADLNDLPQCAVGCLESRCSSMTDMDCICVHSHKEDDVRAKCFIDSCKFEQSLIARNITARACDFPIRNREPTILATCIALLVLTACVVCARLAYKQFFSHARRLSTDDWLIVASATVGIPCICVLLFGLRPSGLGKDVWTLPPHAVLDFAKYFYVMEILYITVIMFVRMTLSVFYLDIFPGKLIRRLLIVTVVYHALCGVAFDVKVILQCLPVSYNWTRYSDQGPQHGHCISLNSSSWANAALGVAADIWLLAIPLSQLSKLKLHWKKKVGAALMLLTGAVGTLVSILRLHSISHFANSTNPTWEQYGIVLWSAIEVMVGMICTSLPALRLILVRIWPRVFASAASQLRSKSSGWQQHPRSSPGHSLTDSASSTKVSKGGSHSMSKGRSHSITNVSKGRSALPHEKELEEASVWSGDVVEGEVVVQRQVDVELADKLPEVVESRGESV